MLSSHLRRGLFLTGRVPTPAVFGMMPAAGFAKFTRDKPHLNVGTIGKYSVPGLPGSGARPPADPIVPARARLQATLTTARPP